MPKINCEQQKININIGAPTIQQPQKIPEKAEPKKPAIGVNKVEPLEEKKDQNQQSSEEKKNQPGKLKNQAFLNQLNSTLQVGGSSERKRGSAYFPSQDAQKILNLISFMDPHTKPSPRNVNKMEENKDASNQEQILIERPINEKKSSNHRRSFVTATTLEEKSEAQETKLFKNLTIGDGLQSGSLKLPGEEKQQKKVFQNLGIQIKLTESQIISTEDRKQQKTNENTDQLQK